MLNSIAHKPLVLCGLGFGDEGKGTITDALARQFTRSMVVRYNGGAQAGHNVVTQKNMWHCFAQFGAGLLAHDVQSLLSEHMVLDVESLMVEAGILKQKIGYDPIERQKVDPRCLIVTPAQRIIGRMKEVARGNARHGSCGMGIGQTLLDNETGLSIRVADMLDDQNGKYKLAALMDALLDQATELKRQSHEPDLAALHKLLNDRADPDALYYALRSKMERMNIEDASDVLKQTDRQLIFEGAQGALLDRWNGFVPYVTKSKTTSEHALAMLAKTIQQETPYVIGIFRAYGHRHGMGPFITEDPSVNERFADRFNPENPWQGAFRVGWLDLPVLRYAIRINPRMDALALTGLDRLSGLNRVRICVAYKTPGGNILTDIPHHISQEERTNLLCACTPEWMEWGGWNQDLTSIRSWNQLPENAKSLVCFLEHPNQLGIPIDIVSVGPTAEHKLFR